MHLGTNMATRNLDCSLQDRSQDFTRALEFDFPDLSNAPDVGLTRAYLGLPSRMSSNINNGKNYSEQLTIEVLDNNTTLLNAINTNENHVSSPPEEPSHSIEGLGFNENDILDWRSEDANGTFSRPNLIQSVIPEEQLRINIETDEEEIMHSWRPNLTNSLSSDFFIAQPGYENSMGYAPNYCIKEEGASPNLIELEIPHKDAFEIAQSQVQPVTNLGPEVPRITHIDIEAYLQSQKAQLNVMKYEVMNAKRRFFEAKNAVEELTHRLKEQQLFQNSGDIEKLKDENAQLRLECQCLCMEVDFYLKGQAPLGEVDEKYYCQSEAGDKNLETNRQSSSCLRVEQQDSTEEERQEEANKWECSKCTFANHPAISSCEMCHMQRQRNESAPFHPALQNTCYCHPTDEFKSS